MRKERKEVEERRIEKKEEGKGWESKGREEKGKIHVIHVTIFISLIQSWKMTCKLLSVINFEMC